MLKAQEYINKKYNLITRKLIQTLNLDRQQLEGDLNLSDFVNLQELIISNNQLTSLKVSKCSRLEKLEADNNRLTTLDLTGLLNLKQLTVANNFLDKVDLSPLCHKKITNLNLSSNNFSSQDLSCFSNLINLEVLFVGNYGEEKLKKGIYNRFYGSLKFLKGLKKLERLAIYNTNVSQDLETLPNSLEVIYCAADKSLVNWQVSKLEDRLEDYKLENRAGIFTPHDYATWKKVMKQLLAGEELQSLRKQINEQGEYFIQQQLETSSQNSQMEPLIKENEKLKKENEQLKTALLRMFKKQKDRTAKKEKQLQDLVGQAKVKLNEQECSTLDDLLEAQKNFIKSGKTYYQDFVETLRGMLEEKLDKRDLDDICNLQAHMVKVELENDYEAHIEILVNASNKITT